MAIVFETMHIHSVCHLSFHLHRQIQMREDENDDTLPDCCLIDCADLHTFAKWQKMMHAKEGDKLATYQTRDTSSESYRRLASGRNWLLINDCSLQLLSQCRARAQSAARRDDANGRQHLLMMLMASGILVMMMVMENCLDHWMNQKKEEKEVTRRD